MWGILNIGLPGNREREGDGLGGEDIDQGSEAILVEHQEADEDESAGKQVGDIEWKAAHLSPPRDTNSSSTPRIPIMKAALRKAETRNTRILAMAVSKSASRTAAMAILPM